MVSSNPIGLLTSQKINNTANHGDRLIKHFYFTRSKQSNKCPVNRVDNAKANTLPDTAVPFGA